MATPYLIRSGDTLGQLAINNKTDIPTLQSLNPQITDINQIQAGAILNLPDTKPTTSAVGQNQAIVSSDLARNQFKTDVENLGSLEAGFQPTTPTPTEKPQEQAVLPPEKPITFKSTNPAFQSLIDQTNESILKAQSGGMPITPEIQQAINNINDFQAKKTSAVAAARDAADAKDATKLNEETTKAKEADSAIKSEIETMRANLKTAQETYITSLTPTTAETDLKRRLITLRTERKLMPVELRQEGISATGIGGRIIEDERTRAIQESNLLAEIGLEQDARKMKSETIEKQAGFIKDDIELQMKIKDRLDKEEKDVLEEARNLRKDSLTALASILDDEKGFGGLDWQDIGQDPQAQADLMNLIKPYPDLTVSLVSKALENVKQQRIFNQAIKLRTGTGTDKLLSPSEATTLGVPYGTTQSQAQAMGIQPQKPATAAQQVTAGYAVRIEQANPILKNLEGYIASKNYLGFKIQSMLPSAFQSSEFQQYDQAARNFINAVLRRESGAAIAASEFDNARKQYLPVSGDSEATLKQKEQNRNIVYANFKQGAGGAYSSIEELLGGGNISGIGESEIYITPDGIEYVKGEDGLYYLK